MQRPSVLRNVWLIAALAALAILPLGCRKKAPVTPAEATPSMATEAAPAPTPSPQPPQPQAEPDPWSGDIESVNRYAREMGLLGDVYFDYDRSELKPEAREQLATNARFFQQHPQFVVTIEGHCDERGTEEYNLALGENRAGSARGYLQNVGVPAHRLQTLSYGKERPICTDRREDCWWRNRRAHFVITGRTQAG